jgi:hypothetical protein
MLVFVGCVSIIASCFLVCGGCAYGETGSSKAPTHPHPGTA